MSVVAIWILPSDQTLATDGAAASEPRLRSGIEAEKPRMIESWVRTFPPRAPTRCSAVVVPGADSRTMTRTVLLAGDRRRRCKRGSTFAAVTATEAGIID